MIRALALLLGGLALAGCSAFKLSYNRLDWIAAWQVGRFVELGPPQKQLFEEGFREFWQWHRGTQLELYARDVRELAAALERPLTPARVEHYLDRSQAYLARALQEIVPDTAQVLGTFDDAQVRELVDNIAERRRKRQEESEGMSREELQADAEDRMMRNLKRWTGPLTREQRQRIRRWAAQRAYAGTIWVQYQEAWANAFTEVLAHRREPSFEARLSALFAEGRAPYGEEMGKVQAHNRQAWIEVMADLTTMLTPEQRRHAQERLREFAADLEELARQPHRQQAAAAGIIG